MTSVATALSARPMPVRSGFVRSSSEEEQPPRDISVGQALSAFVGAGAGAVIETVGVTALSIASTPRNVVQAYKTLWNTERLGPILKTTLGALIPAAAVATPVAAALGSCLYGMYRGFTEGMKGGVGEAIRETAGDVNDFRKQMGGKLIAWLQEVETEPLPPGEEPYEIKVIEGGKGLVGAAAGAVIDGVGVGAVTLVNTPRALVKAFRTLARDEDHGPIWKTTVGVLIPPVALLATPLGVVGGALWGLGTGAAKGYSEGLGPSVKGSVDTVRKYNELVRGALKEDWDS